MARSHILARLSGQKHERRASASNGDVKQVTQHASWRRRSLATLSRKLNPSLKPMLSPSTTGSDAPQARTVPNPEENEPEPELPTPYSKPVEVIREEEYSHMNQGTYLDHSGATIHARTTLLRTTTLLLTNLYGNPHSANTPAALSTTCLSTIRRKTLLFLGADPAHYDLVFTVNATAAIKLVAEAFRDLGERYTRSGGFWYGYHPEAHTSLVGVREVAGEGEGFCFEGGDGEVEAWLKYSRRMDGNDGTGRVSSLGLFAYPGQSNLTGRRLPLGWAGRVRAASRKRGGGGGLRDTYTLLDAAALAMTASLAPVFADPEAAPDFVCVAFYKIFGFPDLGGLVVRKESGHVLALRRYFGGGTVSMVSAIGGAWHLSKGMEAVRGGGPGEGEHGAALHEGLEDGTLPFHSILALGEAIDVHAELYGSMDNISAYTTALVRRMYLGMKRLRYANGQPLCKIYGDEDGGAAFGDARRQGATMAFNVFRPDGGYESYATVERLANDRGIYVRSGGICCPGGLFTALQYEPWQLHRARSAGHHCGSNGLSLINELPTGVVRASLGAMSTAQDVDRFLAFLEETFIIRGDSAYASSNGGGSAASNNRGHSVRLSAEEYQAAPQIAA